MVSFGEVLKDFKDNEEPDSIVPIIENEDLRNGIVAWKSVQVQYRGTAAQGCEDKDSVKRWDWMWAQITFDQGKFGVVAGIKAQEVQSLLARLIGLRLIYPDGTINTYARQYLQSIIVSRLKISGRKNPPEKPPGRP